MINVLILGAQGMLGRCIFLYLKTQKNFTVWGTTRSKKIKESDYFFFEVQNAKRDFKQIINKVAKVDYVINCIGLIDSNKSNEELLSINCTFPHQLEDLTEQYDFKLIHISTDGVFSAISGLVNESDKTSPSDNYGKSKLHGETIKMNAITIRSSFIGFDPIKHKGVLEYALKEENIQGFTNQIWTGSTTLQFARLLEDIIINNKFREMRKVSPVFHFAPLDPISKYAMLSTFAQLVSKEITIRKTRGEERKRILKSNYDELLGKAKYTNNIKTALSELIYFENFQTKQDDSSSI